MQWTPRIGKQKASRQTFRFAVAATRCLWGGARLYGNLCEFQRRKPRQRHLQARLSPPLRDFPSLLLLNLC